MAEDKARGLQRWPQPEHDANERDKSATQHLAIAFERAELEAREPHQRADAERAIGGDRADREEGGHHGELTDAIARRREERRDAFHHRGGPEDQQKRHTTRPLVTVGMERGLIVDHRRQRMSGFRHVMVPVRMWEAACVHVPVEVPRHPRASGKLHVERVCGERLTRMLMITAAMAMIVTVHMRMIVTMDVPRSPPLFEPR